MVETPARLIKPYSRYWHPHKSWLDLFVSFVVWLIFPLHKMAECPADKDSEETTKKHENFRSKMVMGAESGAKGKITKWEANSKCPIVQFDYTIKRTALLKEWGLYKESFDDKYPPSDITVILRFPASILEETKGGDSSKKSNKNGCVALDELDIKSLPSDIPLLLHFYGGGMTIGVHSDGDGLELTQKVCELAGKPVIIGGVCYSQSPEHPFPVAVEEALTAVSHFLTALPNHKIHLTGISAGGNLAAVATMEMHRKFPGRIASVMTLCPMLNPAADTLSFYMNRNAFSISGEWIRWCWRAYLHLPENKESSDIMKLDKMDARLMHGSNRTTWDESPFNKGSLARLVNPNLDIPKGLDAHGAPKFLVHTNAGDALRDDGVEFVESLKSAGATVKYLPQEGTHWFGTVLDKQSHAAVVAAWSDLLFSD
jgi:acetyl esterase/lipase